MCGCSEINCSPVKVCEGVIVKLIKLVLFSFQDDLIHIHTLNMSLINCSLLLRMSEE